MLLVSIVSTNTSNQIEVSAVDKQPVKNLDPKNIATDSYVVCMYAKKWWLAIVLENCFEKGDVRIRFSILVTHAEISSGQRNQIHVVFHTSIS